MARNLIPELEKLNERLSMDNQGRVYSQNLDAGLLKSPWRSPGWKKEDKENDVEGQMKEPSRRVLDTAKLMRRARTTAPPALTLSQLTASACSPVLPGSPSPTPATRASLRPRPPPDFAHALKDRRASLDSRIPEQPRTRSQTTPPRYSSAFLASPFLPTFRASTSMGKMSEACPSPRRKRPVSVTSISAACSASRPLLGARGVSDPLSIRSRPMTATIHERSDEEDEDDEEEEGVEQVETPSKVIHRRPVSDKKTRVRRWIEESGQMASGSRLKLDDEDEDREMQVEACEMGCDSDSMASGCGDLLDPEVSPEEEEGYSCYIEPSQPCGMTEGYSCFIEPSVKMTTTTSMTAEEEEGFSCFIEPSVKPIIAKTEGRRNIFGTGRPLLYHVDSRVSSRTDGTTDSAETMELPSPTPSPGHQGTLRGLKALPTKVVPAAKKALKSPLVTLTNVQDQKSLLQVRRPVHRRAATSPLAKTHSYKDMQRDEMMDIDGEGKDGFDLDELNFELESAEVDMELGFRIDDIQRISSRLGDQEDSGLAMDAHDPSLVSMWLKESPSSRRTSRGGIKKNISSPDLAGRVAEQPRLRHVTAGAFQRYSHDDDRDLDSPDFFFGSKPQNIRSVGGSMLGSPPCQRSSPESPTPSGLVSPITRPYMLGDLSGRRGSLDVPPPRDRTSLQEGTLMDQLFPKARQNSFNRPGMPRRTTAPAAAGRSDEMDFPPILLKPVSDKRKSLLSNASSASPHPSPAHLPAGTPNHAFDCERPSPAAFMSTGLVKKGSRSFQIGRRERSTTNGPPLPSAVKRRPISLFVDTQFKMPDTPIKNSTHVIATSLMSMEKPRLPPFKLPPMIGQQPSADFTEPLSAITAISSKEEHRMGKFSRRNWERTDTADSIVTVMPNDGSKAINIRSNGLRRKGSALWARTTSGNWSNGSWSKQNSFSIDEREPITPTRSFDHAVTRLDFTAVDTPSPQAPVRTYPFAHGVAKQEAVPSPSPPRRKSTLLQRLQGSKHKTLRRISNPLLSAAYKLGEQQVQLGNHIKNLSIENHKVQKPSRPVTPVGVSRFEREYIMLEPIGNGEFSTVWKVKERKSARIWAVKRGKPYLGAKDRKRQLEEVKVLETLAKTANPYVLQFQEAWEEKEQLHIRTNLAGCGDLATYLNSIEDVGGLDEGRCWKMLFELTSGLRHIHACGILHLDLKPSNILVTEEGRLQISDFGLSVFDNGENYDPTRSPCVGSPREGDREYLSPETLSGKFGKATDVYSLGITLLEASLNVTLPSNGIAWQKLRSDDFSDLEEHLTSGGQHTESTPAADTSIPLSPSGTSISSESSLASLQIDLPPSRGPSRELLVTIKGMMRSDPLDRWTLQDVWDFPVLQRLLGMHSAERSTRVSLESVARSSLDDWEDWHRQRGQLSLNPSPSSARISIPILQLRQQASPALVPESPDFLDDILRCWQRLYI